MDKSYHSKHQQLIKLASDVMRMSRNTLAVNLRYMDTALFRFEPQANFEISSYATNGGCFLYNPVHVLKSYREEQEHPVRSFLHLVLHCVFCHPFVGKTINQKYWNLACDIAVEYTISTLNLKSTKTGVQKQQEKYFHTLNAKLKALTAEHIYHYLLKSELPYNEYKKICRLFTFDDHLLWYITSEQADSNHSNHKKTNTDINKVTSNSSNKSSETGNSNDAFPEGKNYNQKNDKSQESVDFQDFSGEKSNSGDESESKNSNANITKEEAEQIWRKVSRRIQVDAETFQQGIKPGGLTQNLREVNREKYDYTAFLKKFAVLGETIKLNDEEFDYVFYTYGLQLFKNMPLIEPLEYKEVKRIREFVIAIDTSGSVSGELVQRFIQKTYNILQSTESFFSKINVHIIQCDAEVQEDKKITCREEFDDYLKTMDIHGLGGTDFRPVFDYVNQLLIKKEFINLKGLIYFTDGCGFFPPYKPKYETAFVFIDNEYNIPDVPPWAIKLVLTEEI